MTISTTVIECIQKGWCEPRFVNVLLWPLGWLYCVSTAIRRWLYRVGLMTSFKINATVIVVGNLSVGGTGKTPLTIALADMFVRSGCKPGIVTRGYGGQSLQWPQQVTANSDPIMVGDEAILLARRSGIAVVAAPDRVCAAQWLVAKLGCDTIICDDGFQHFRLRRDIDIVVVDGVCRFGNGWCLPAGPLRENVSGLNRADLVVSTQPKHPDEYLIVHEISMAISLHDSTQQVSLMHFSGKVVHAIAAIGNPDRFFNQLESYNIIIKRHPFQDHHNFSQSDLGFDDAPILMTEKDAVKCERLKMPESTWFVPLTMKLNVSFETAVKSLL